MKPPEKIDFSEFEKEIAAFEEARKNVLEQQAGAEEIVNQRILKPFPFDPNKLTVEKWKEMGFGENRANVIKNYLAAGGRFKKKEDLKKIYCISDEDYKIMEPFISIEPEKKISGSVKKDEEIAINPFPFNPNNLPSEKWKELGLKDNQIRNIKNYEKAGGKFFVKEDLKNLYTISEKEYTILEKFIQLPSTDSLRKTMYAGKDTTLLYIELNSADSAELVKLKGIGSSFARRIIKYRSLLGGYYKKEQLLEVFGMDTSRYYGFVKNVFVDSDSIRRMNLNDVEFKKLLKHPYLEYYIVKSIFNYKDKNEQFNSVSELKNVDLVYAELFERISPYLEVEKINENQ